MSGDHPWPLSDFDFAALEDSGSSSDAVANSWVDTAGLDYSALLYEDPPLMEADNATLAAEWEALEARLTVALTAPPVAGNVGEWSKEVEEIIVSLFP
jgi:hypothetical protein